MVGVKGMITVGQTVLRIAEKKVGSWEPDWVDRKDTIAVD
jgi:hypothetical protein